MARPTSRPLATADTPVAAELLASRHRRDALRLPALSNALATAAQVGSRTCILHFASQNFSGGPFWLKQGFVPVEYTMDRTVDQRVLWGRS